MPGMNGTDWSVVSEGVRIQRLSLGLGPLGNLYKVVSEDEAQATLQAWWDSRLRCFDVAPLYGYGIAETRLGRFLAGRERSSFVVSTKVGRPLRQGAEPDPTILVDGEPIFRGTPPGVNPVFDYSEAGIRSCLEASQRRLGLDRIDIVYVHDPDRHLWQALDEAVPVLCRLQQDGLIGAIGVGTGSVATALAFVREAPIQCVMLAGRFTLLEQEALRELLPLCLERHVGVVAVGVLGSGFLADPRPGAHYDYEPTADAALLERARSIARLCSEYGVPLKAAAIQYPATHSAVASVAIGASTEAHAREGLQSYELPIPPDLWRRLEAEGLVGIEASAVKYQTGS